MNRLVRKVKREASEAILCAYEAGPCGYGLQRELQEQGLECQVIAPSLIPRKPGDWIKADRRDARRLAEPLEGGLLTEVFTSIVNKEGLYQVVTEHLGTPLEISFFVPRTEPTLGADSVRIQGSSIQYAYSWLRMADWALIVQWSAPRPYAFLAGTSFSTLSYVATINLMIFFVILHRARRLVQLQLETDQTKAQLEHAAKLASVGELAAGIAYEVNNPLAIVTE